ALFAKMRLAGLAAAVDQKNSERGGLSDELCKRALRLTVVSNRPVERWRNLGPVRASWSIAGVVVLGISFVDRQALKDEGGNRGASLVVEFCETGESIQPFPFNPIEAAEHHFCRSSFLEEAVDGLPFETAPFLCLIVLA